MARKTPAFVFEGGGFVISTAMYSQYLLTLWHAHMSPINNVVAVANSAALGKK